MIQQTLFTNWHFMRWLRLGLGLFISYQAIQAHDILAGLVAAFLLYQVAINAGCCGANACNSSYKGGENHDLKEIQFEEIK